MKPARAIAATPANRPQAFAFSAVSTGSIAWLSTSQNRKSRIPVAVAVKKAFSYGDSQCIRPIGRPRKIVRPAIAPSSKVWAVDIVVRLTLQKLVSTVDVRYGTGPLGRRIPGDDLLPRLPDRRVPASVDGLPHARVTGRGDARRLARLGR